MRPVTIADVIRMTRLADPSYVAGGSSSGHVAQFSPDEKEFVVVLRSGNVENNTNEYSVLLWNADTIFYSPSPKLLLKMSSSSNRPAVEAVSWGNDGETILFLGESPGERHQLYSFNIRKRTLKKLTASATNLLSYSMSVDGDVILYSAERGDTSLFEKQTAKVGLVVSDQPITDLLSGYTKGEGEATSSLDKQLFVQSYGGRPKCLSAKLPMFAKSAPPSLSPNGEYAVLLALTKELANDWKDYLDAPLQKDELQRGWALHYLLLDTRTGEKRDLINAPLKAWTFPRIAWSSDSRSVVVTDTYLPLAGVDPEERKARVSTAFAVEVSIPSGEINKVSDERLDLLHWDAKRNDLVFQKQDTTHESKPTFPTLVFHKSGDHWEKVSERLVEETRPSIVLEEDMNTPPAIVARRGSPQGRTELMDLNPQFKDLRFSHEELIRWKSSDGRQVIGGLYYPIDYVAGKRYPLVIQTHAFTSSRFWIDGPWSTAFAAQPLAGRGIMVLQAYTFPEEGYSKAWEDYLNDFGTPKEVDREVAVYEGAIDTLDRKGLIDRDRVGIIGFSRTCLSVKYMLTRDAYRFAAASVTDGLDGGYFQYISYPQAMQTIEALNGAPPFGSGFQSWLKRSPGFSIDSVRTPLRIVALNPGSLLGEWEWFAALTRLGKRVEMVAIRDGTHELQRPWDRIVSQEQNVDWFDFWLNEKEDQDAAKVEQYARWRKMRGRR